jgi:hypothetical protein
MSFPGTYNINYYKGDTFEFRVYPKDNAGNAFSLSGFSTVSFTISNILGEGPGKVTIDAYAAVDPSGFILCAIRPEDAELMVAGTTYVYDVEMKRVANPYDYVYTLLSGSITVTEEVTLADVLVPPGTPGAMTLSNITSTSVTCTWTASAGTIDEYVIALLSNPLDETSIIETHELSPTTLTYTFTGLTPATTYGFGVVASNTAGNSSPSGNFGTTLGA